MTIMADQIMRRVRAKGRGWVFTPKHFIDFGTRGSIDVALSRLVQAGSIRRIGRGLYDYPRVHTKLGILTPDTSSIASTLSAQTGDKLAPSGATAANQLGLSTQVPAKASFATTGRTRVKKAAGRSVTLRHSRAPVLDKASDTVNSVIQALAHLGKKNVDGDVINSFARRIDDHDMKVLMQSRPLMPGWMGDTILKIGAARNG